MYFYFFYLFVSFNHTTWLAYTSQLAIPLVHAVTIYYHLRYLPIHTYRSEDGAAGDLHPISIRGYVNFMAQQPPTMSESRRDLTPPADMTIPT